MNWSPVLFYEDRNRNKIKKKIEMEGEKYRQKGKELSGRPYVGGDGGRKDNGGRNRVRRIREG